MNKTSYNFNKLHTSEVKEVHEGIIQKYINFVKSCAYTIINPVKINSGIDPTVYLI